MCPHPSCHQYYTIESVNALRTLLPQKAEFFGKFDLDERKMDVFLKDDAVTQGIKGQCYAFIDGHHA
ncbi:unnamed protein product [Gongylonema pulchrum]|uniref:ParB domain-containing protein n=1 Tax=Gongylonema pulchrum TaxID=637853 RepID=A0A183EU11_9BILA|nr:unnamed protein product [Gongylonema pulchrum]